MIRILIDIALFIVGGIIGINFGAQQSHAEGFDDGFKAGKECMLHKIELNSRYGKFSNGREE